MPVDLLKKLRFNLDSRALVLNAPEEFVTGLGRAVDVQPQGTYPFVVVFLRSQAEFTALSPVAVQAAIHDGLLWLVYPKKTSSLESDLSRDVLWHLMEPTGLRPVTLVAVDEDWSAMRFRPIDKVGR
jgi:hypothetical protein